MRVNPLSSFTWQNYKDFLRDRTTQSRETHDQDSYDRWNHAGQRRDESVSQYISYLNRMKSYLPPDMQHTNYMQMSKLKSSVLPELVAEMTGKESIKKSTTYEELQRNIIEIESSLTQKKQIQSGDSRRYKRDRSSDDDPNDRPSKSSRGSDREGRGRDRGGRSEENHNDSQEDNRDDRRGDDRGREREGRDRGRERRGERREGDTPATGSNTDPVDREKKQKERDERQTNESCFKCESKSHWAKECKEESKN